jgi:hypothetical protein
MNTMAIWIASPIVLAMKERSRTFPLTMTPAEIEPQRFAKKIKYYPKLSLSLQTHLPKINGRKTV